MNRVIKFRAWNPKGDMLAPFEMGDGTTNEKLLREEGWPLMQFTGLTDKNGRDIYEGDLLKIPDDWDTYGHNAGETLEVYFAFGSFRLKPKYDKSAKGHTFEDSNDQLEIIGNIYENPNLLGS